MIQYYTYTLTNSLDSQVFYVGKGSGTRMYQHVREAQHATKIKRSVHYKILSILAAGGEVVYNKVDHPSEQDAFVNEIRLIALHGRKDLKTGILCNLTEGGEGGRMVNLESVESRAAKHRGMKRSDEAKQRMKQAQLDIAARMREQFGKGCSPEQSTRCSEARKGKVWSENARAVKRNKPTALPVLVYKKDTGEFVGEWESTSLCAKELGIDSSAVWKICEGGYQMKSSKGYTFKYK